MNESQAYEAIHAAVFGVAEEADCSVMTLIGILETVKAELMSTILEDSPPAEDDFEEEELIG